MPGWSRTALAVGRASCGALALAAAATTPGAGQAPPQDRLASSPPDISGVWATIAVARPDGSSGFRDPPLSDAGQAIVDAFRGQYDLEGHEPNAHCIEPGMPTMMFGYGGAPIEIIQEPDRITMLHELAMQVRRIYMDGRGHPEDFFHTRSGHSIATWEDGALVVDTTLLMEWLLPRWPHTDDLHIVERFSLQARDEVEVPEGYPGWRPDDPSELILVDEITFIDPALYDEPQELLVYFSALPDDQILEDNCPEGLWWEVMESLRRE